MDHLPCSHTLLWTIPTTLSFLGQRINFHIPTQHLLWLYRLRILELTLTSITTAVTEVTCQHHTIDIRHTTSCTVKQHTLPLKITRLESILITLIPFLGILRLKQDNSIFKKTYCVEQPSYQFFRQGKYFEHLICLRTRSVQLTTADHWTSNPGGRHFDAVVSKRLRPLLNWPVLNNFPGFQECTTRSLCKFKEQSGKC